MTAFSTLDPCEAVMQDAAVQVSVNDLLYVVSYEPILLGKAIITDPLKFFKIVFNTLIILRILRLSWSVINSRCVGHVLVPLRQDEEPPNSLYGKSNCK